MERKLNTFLGRVDGSSGFRHRRSNGNTQQVAYRGNKDGTAWFQSSTSHDSPNKFCPTHASIVYDGCFCHDRLFISDARSTAVLWTMGTARSYRPVRIYGLDILIGNSWLSEYPCRNRLGKAVGRGTPSPTLFIVSCKRWA